MSAPAPSTSVSPAPRIVIAGAGPAAQALVRQLDGARFRGTITVLSNRDDAPAELLDLAGLPQVSVRFGQPASFIDPDTRTVTLAMTGSTALPLMGELARLVGEQAPHMVLRLRTMALTGPSDAVFTHEGVDALLLPRAFATSYAREPLYDDRWVVLTGGSTPDRPVTELIETLPHVVLDSTTYRVRPYEVLDERGLRYAVRTRVSDNLLIPHVVAATGALAFHRLHAVADMTRYLDLRLHEFPFPIGRLGIDLVWNPWLADEELREWLGEILREAVASTAG